MARRHGFWCCVEFPEVSDEAPSLCTHRGTTGSRQSLKQRQQLRRQRAIVCGEVGKRLHGERLLDPAFVGEVVEQLRNCGYFKRPFSFLFPVAI